MCFIFCTCAMCNFIQCYCNVQHMVCDHSHSHQSVSLARKEAHACFHQALKWFIPRVLSGFDTMKKQQSALLRHTDLLGENRTCGRGTSEQGAGGVQLMQQDFMVNRDLDTLPSWAIGSRPCCRMPPDNVTLGSSWRQEQVRSLSDKTHEE